MKEESFSLNNFTHSVYLDIPPEKVYYYLAAANGICKWFLGNAEYTDSAGNILNGDSPASAGCSFKWKWLNKDLSIEGSVIDSVTGKIFAFTFGKSFEAVFTIEAHEGRTLLTLEQKYAANAEKNDFAHINCCVCWVFFLTNLKSVSERGFDLRETVSTDDSLINR